MRVSALVLWRDELERNACENVSTNLSLVINDNLAEEKYLDDTFDHYIKTSTRYEYKAF